MNRRMHPHACLAAQYARCAGAFGHEFFWQMHDAIFALSSLSRDSLASLPEEIGLSAEAIDACVRAPATISRIQTDIAQGVTLRIPGTPAIYINGKLSPSIAKEALLALFDEAAGT